jgi:hypothetical protein
MLGAGLGAPQVLSKLTREYGILTPAGDPSAGRRPPYLFLHRTFHEFLVADHLAARPFEEWWPAIEANLWFEPDWTEVIALLGSRLRDPSRFLSALTQLRADPFHAGLFHVSRVAAEVPPGRADEAVSNVVGQLLNVLRSPASAIRKGRDEHFDTWSEHQCPE